MKITYIFILLFVTAYAQAQIVTIPDANFKNALVNSVCADFDGNSSYDGDVDTNNDGEIQVSEAEAVLGLYVVYENIVSLEGIHSFANLEELICRDNQLTSLDLSQNQHLTLLECQKNQLNNLNVSNNLNLDGLFCFENQLTSLDLSGNSNLRTLICNENQLTSLDIKNGNNINMGSMWSFDNPNLICIQVDDVNDANSRNCEFAIYGWCTDSTTTYSESCSLGLISHNSITFTMSPNPTQNELNIQSKNLIHSIKIYSIQGQLIKESSSTKIDVSSLNVGIYFAQFSIEGKTITKRFIKS